MTFAGERTAETEVRDWRCVRLQGGPEKVFVVTICKSMYLSQKVFGALTFRSPFPKIECQGSACTCRSQKGHMCSKSREAAATMRHQHPHNHCQHFHD